MGFKDSGVVKETVVFNGRRYNRYPESNNPAHRRYFGRAGHRLHRDVWETHNGPIPNGCDIHHLDGDTGNNSISNLECVASEDHREIHKADVSSRSRQQEHLDHLAAIRPAAAAWHSSEEGRAWHREHARGSLAAARAAKAENGPPEIAVVCFWCGTEHIGKSSRRKFCSTACQTAESRFRRGKRSNEHPHHAASVRP